MPCTPEGLGISGADRSFETVLVPPQAGQCRSGLLTSTADVDAMFPGDTAPAELRDVDFSVDRVVLGSSNPALRFVLDDGVSLTVAQEPLCQGAAPLCIAYIVRGTTSDELVVESCPYRGPEPCDAP